MLRTYLIGAAVGIAGSLAAMLVAAVAPLDLDPKMSGAAAFVFWHTYTSNRTIHRVVAAFRAESRRRRHAEHANREAFLQALKRLAPHSDDEI